MRKEAVSTELERIRDKYRMDWEENDHPRDNSGKFTAGNGATGGSAKSEKAPASEHAKKVQKAIKKIGNSTQKINGDTYLAMNLRQIYPGTQRSGRVWGKIVDKSLLKKVGSIGDFDIHSKGFWGSGDNDSYGYELVLKE